MELYTIIDKWLLKCRSLHKLRLFMSHHQDYGWIKYSNFMLALIEYDCVQILSNKDIIILKASDPKFFTKLSRLLRNRINRIDNGDSTRYNENLVYRK